MSWHFSQGPEGGFSVADYLAGIRSRRSRLNTTRAKSSCSDSGTDSCRTSPSGMTSALLMGDLGGGLSMSLAEVSHVRTSARRERVRVSRGVAPDSGLRCTESFARFDRDSCLWRTPQCSLLADLDVFSETWPRAGMMRRGWCWELQMSELRMSARESGFSRMTWLTPMALDGMRSTMKLESLAKHWEKHPNSNLAEQVAARMLPTPMANDAKNNGGPGQQARKSPQLGAVVGGALNPPWVEWLMGWPIGWTDSSPLEMDRFRLWLQLHSVSLNEFLKER